jgi:hypothetical protein
MSTSSIQRSSAPYGIALLDAENIVKRISPNKVPGDNASAIQDIVDLSTEASASLGLIIYLESILPTGHFLETTSALASDLLGLFINRVVTMSEISDILEENLLPFRNIPDFFQTLEDVNRLMLETLEILYSHRS